MKHTYRIEKEISPEPCGYDYQSFIDGYNCKEPVTKVIIEDIDFHFAHLCDGHTEIVMKLLTDMDLVTDEVIPTCDICGRPEDQEANGREYNWNSETGNHISCEDHEEWLNRKKSEDV